MAATCMSFNISIKFFTVFTVKIYRFSMIIIIKRIISLKNIKRLVFGEDVQRFVPTRTEFLNII